MALEFLLSLVYQVIQHSWMFATVFVKYFLAGVIVKQLYEGAREPETFLDAFDEYSREVVSVIVVSGILLTFAGFEIQPFAKPFSELVALAYFAFLFWRF